MRFLTTHSSIAISTVHNSINKFVSDSYIKEDCEEDSKEDIKRDSIICYSALSYVYTTEINKNLKNLLMVVPWKIVY